MKIDDMTAATLNQANDKATNAILELIGQPSSGSLHCLIKGIIQEEFQAAIREIKPQTEKA